MNLTALNNIQPFEVNTSLINNSAEIGTNIVNNANVTSEGYFGLGVLVSIFLFCMIITTTQQDLFRLTFLQSLVFSSGIVTIIGILGLLGNIFSSFQHVMWFTLLFIVGLIATYLKGKS